LTVTATSSIDSTLCGNNQHVEVVAVFGSEQLRSLVTSSPPVAFEARQNSLRAPE
jgi:hypothetical protein